MEYLNGISKTLPERPAQRVRLILEDYRSQRRLTEIASKIKVSAPRLSEIIAGTREVTTYYFLKLLGEKYMTMDQIFRERFDEMTEEEQVFFVQLSLTPEFIKKLIRAKQKGIDPERVLDSIIGED